MSGHPRISLPLLWLCYNVSQGVHQEGGSKGYNKGFIATGTIIFMWHVNIIISCPSAELQAEESQEKYPWHLSATTSSKHCTHNNRQAY